MKKIALAVFALAISQTIAAKGIIAENAYARPTIDGMKQGGMFVKLTNTDSTDNALVAAKISPKIAQYTELHTHTHENGVAKMHSVPEIALPAGQTVELKSGSFHIMFFNLKQKLSVGKKFPITLQFKDGSKQKIQVEVKNPQNHQTDTHEHSHAHEHQH